MNRREFNSLQVSWLAALVAGGHSSANALTLAELSQGQATRGLLAALERGATSAVQMLGRPGGFWDNEKVRIPLPGYLEDAAQVLRMLGQGGRVDDLVMTMNRAAEAAVPTAKKLLLSAVRSMSVNDAKQILSGGETAVTTFFADKTREPLSAQFLPIVSRATARVGLADKYNQVAGKAANLGLLRREDASIENYVTAKSLDGLYLMIGEEERKIRSDPVGTGSALLKQVFGALR